MCRIVNCFVFLLVIVGFLMLSCGKESKTESPLSGYFTENSINLIAKGTYNKVKLDEKYVLNQSKEHIIIGYTQRVIYSYEGTDTVQYQIAEFEIFNQKLDSRISFEILFNDISYNVNYYHNLVKKINENQVINIEGQNSFVVPMGTNKEVPPESLPKIYRINNFSYNASTGYLTFELSVRYDDGKNTNYSLDGIVEIYTYSN